MSVFSYAYDCCNYSDYCGSYQFFDFDYDDYDDYDDDACTGCGCWFVGGAGFCYVCDALVE